ncbi:hypothetical protein BEWA_032390 [Theileria equi strain WA]|uniref:Uncharacterized protein n=1 Tax=Theileria equi strain WA TaxID=1537102 RepID=L0AZH4_THEEQ|nr:hypothetical protein BEWA_032390 [Theileria equi strain WA]AFZ80386.1 hypothetical protein BEWA_032390 [Theileria equi strain WA]|eukprot:XP_004830052.1 hypothetical protein BEWA_032390 [Theileria equi strain WA]
MAQNGGLQKGAMFMAGLTLLQSLRVALTGAKFALDRFKIPQQHASSFINMVHNPMELATFTGMAIINIVLIWTDGCNGCKESFRYLAAFTNVTLCFSFILLLYAFTSGGQMGNLTSYYWAIVLASFIYGLNVATVMTVASTDASLFNVGIPISGIQVSVYYFVFTKLAERYNWSNVSYRIIFWQLIIAILISAASAIVWTIAYYPSGTAGANGDTKSASLSEGLPKAWSPILMAMVGMGGIYAFYPAIAPYKLTDVGTGYTIDLVVLFMSAVPGIIIAALCSFEGKGPDQEWKGQNINWNYIWFLAIPHITVMILCLVTLHYPDSGVAGSIKSSGLNAGIITVTLKFCEEGLKAVSYAGAGKQVGKYCSCNNNNCRDCQCCKTNYELCKDNCTCRDCTCKCCKDKDGGAISSFNTFTSQFLMIVLAFTGDGYLKTYSKYEHDRSKWPTKDYGFFKSLGYWTWNGMKVACKSVKSSFTKNVRCKVLGKSEALLIVYEDQEF